MQGLTDEQLALPKRPPGAKPQSLAETIERALIGHLNHHHHHAEIEAKLRARP